jgi:hypothetical protein
MRPVRRGGAPTLALALAFSACAHSITSTFDPLNGQDASVAPVSSSAPTDPPAPDAPTATGSSSGSDLAPYDAGAHADAEAGTDGGGPIDVATDTGDSGYEATVPCTPQSCSAGCCDTSGRCVGMLDTACGKGGGACLDCTLVGSRCSAGSCSSGGSSSSDGGAQDAGGGPFVCNALTCVFGCCQDGTCMFFSSDTACGLFGATCQDCTANHQTCVLGYCN